MRRLLLPFFLLPLAAAEPPGQVRVELRAGGSRTGTAVALEGSRLLLELSVGARESIPLAEVAALRFGRAPREPASPEQKGELWECLLRLRRAPFATPDFKGLLDGGRASWASRAASLAARLRETPDPARRRRLALNLAALRFALGDLDASREALRTAKALAGEQGDAAGVHADCARLAALQMPASGAFDPGSPDWMRAEKDLLAGVTGEGDREALTERISILKALAGATPRR